MQLADHLLHTNKDGQTFLRGKLVTSYIGKGGIVQEKSEGDGATPVGSFRLLQVYYRPDRLSKPETQLPVEIIEPNMGWCDDSSHPLYNQLVYKPFSASHEDLWLGRNVYDIIIVTSHNQDPVIPNAGSAVFIHLRGDQGYTEGCLALEKDDLLDALRQYKEGDVWSISLD